MTQSSSLQSKSNSPNQIVPRGRCAPIAWAAAMLAAMVCAFGPIAAADVDATANVEPTLKIINFTADWCPNCAVLNPMLDEAIERFGSDDVVRVDLDLTAARSSSEEARERAFREAIAVADSHQVAYLWEWYGGITGVAVIVSADNGEPLSCAQRNLSTDEIETRIRESLVLSLRAPAGMRKPQGPDCPPPLRN